MNYFKVIIDGNVVDVGTVFLKWNNGKHHMYLCGLNEAQFVQGLDGNTAYRDDWLKAYEGKPSPFIQAKVIIIDATEYDELRALLEDGEDIPEPPAPAPEPEPEPDEEPKPEPDNPMTIAEMRQHVADMVEQVEMLTECILEMSEVVYSG